MVEEYFYLSSRFLDVCPEPLLRSSSIVVLFQAAVAGVSIHHREAQKGVLNFVERVRPFAALMAVWIGALLTLVLFLSSLLYQLLNIAMHPRNSQHDQSAELAGKLLMEQGQSLMNSLVYSLAGQTPAYAIDEDYGSFSDVMWNLKMFSTEAFTVRNQYST